MNTSLAWIKAYVPDLDVTAQEYTDAMTLTGTKVEGFEKMDADLDKIVVGQIDKIEKHPDADKLIICQVNIGTESIQIVTGAPNVKEGDKVPVVLDGGRVAGGHDGKMTPGGIKIKKGKLRGVESCGMMCSIEELGSTREMYPEAPEYGIYIFPEDAVVGESAIKALGLDDVVIEYEITSNRVDCYGVLGIAREAAATFDKKFVPPVVKETGNDEKASDYVKVTVEDPEELTKEFLQEVEDKYHPERVIFECNGMYPVSKMEALNVPDGWGLIQEITTVDASTFDVYIANMKSLFVEMVRNADMVLFNRCTEDMPLAGYRRSVKVVNQGAQIIFEGAEGEISSAIRCLMIWMHRLLRLRIWITVSGM